MTQAQNEEQDETTLPASREHALSPGRQNFGEDDFVKHDSFWFGSGTDDSPRRTREGIPHALAFGPPERRVQVILLDTRSFRSHVGNIGSMGMQFHVVHHLHPRIPLLRTPRAYWEMRDIIEARGCDVSKL